MFVLLSLIRSVVVLHFSTQDYQTVMLNRGHCVINYAGENTNEGKFTEWSSEDVLESLGKMAGNWLIFYLDRLKEYSSIYAQIFLLPIF
jgi:hypothetical protein